MEEKTVKVEISQELKPTEHRAGLRIRTEEMLWRLDSFDTIG